MKFSMTGQEKNVTFHTGDCFIEVIACTILFTWMLDNENQ